MAMFGFPSFIKVAIAMFVMFGAYHGPSLIIHMAPPGLGFFVQSHESDKLIPEDKSNIMDSLLGNMIGLLERTPFLDYLTSSLSGGIQWTTLNNLVQMEETDFPISSYFKVNKGFVKYSYLCFIILCLILFLFSLINMLKREHKSPEKEELLKIEPKAQVKQESEKNHIKLSVVDIDIYDSIGHNNDLILTREPLIEVSLTIPEQFSNTEKTSSLKKAVNEAECLPECHYKSRCSSQCQQENESEEQTPVSDEIVPSDMVEKTDGIKGAQELDTNNNDDDDYDDDQLRKTQMTPDLKNDDEVITKIVDLPNLLPLSPSDYESIGTFDNIIKRGKPLKNRYKLMLTFDEAKHLDETFLSNLQHQYEGQCSLTYSKNKMFIYFKGKKPVVQELSNEIRCRIYTCIQEAPENIIRRLHEEEEEKKSGEQDDRPVKKLVRYHLREKDDFYFAFSVSEMARRIIIGKWGWNYKRVQEEHKATLDVCIRSQIILLKGPKADVQLLYDSLKDQVENSRLV